MHRKVEGLIKPENTGLAKRKVTRRDEDVGGPLNQTI